MPALPALLICIAHADELVDPVVLTGTVTSSDGRTFVATQPMYLLPTPTFDLLLQDGVGLKACQAGLAEIKAEALTFEQRMSETLTQSRTALTGCSSELGTRTDQMTEATNQVLTLQLQNERLTRQRNTAMGVVGGLLTIGVAVAGAAVAF